MRTILSLTIISLNIIVNAQNNTYPWPSSGDVGIGINITNANLQIHGT